MFEISQVECIDLGRSSYPLSTGIGFLDHMLDQLNSHAQIGVAITLQQQSPHHPNHNSNETKDHVNRHAQCDQGILQDQVGTALGTHLKSLLDNKAHVVPGATSRFCCPLDEALVECTLTRRRTTTTPTSSTQFQLAPYGEFPSTTGGRRHIGYMETQHVETFFKALAQSSGIEISLCKIRGRNGHHIVESAFKAFSRALRNLLDGSTTTTITTTMATTSSSTAAKDLTTAAAPPPPHKTEQLWGRTSESYQQSKALQRTGKVERTTKETSILVHLTLNGGSSNGNGSKTTTTLTPGIETGIGSLNEFYHYIATEAQMELILHCQGDVWVDDHHTSEDVSIAVGQVLHQALGTKAGLNRMWCATATYGSAVVEVTMDLSNRPCLTHNLSLSESGEEYVTPPPASTSSSTSDSDSRTCGQWSVEMMEHALESLVMNALMTVHVVEHTPGTTVYETTMATAQAFGKALYFCAAVDPRRAGKTASSKGTLSV